MTTTKEAVAPQTRASIETEIGKRLLFVKQESEKSARLFARSGLHDLRRRLEQVMRACDEAAALVGEMGEKSRELELGLEAAVKEIPDVG